MSQLKSLSRRDFLRRTSAAGAGYAVGSLVSKLI
ncbi:twin-arginine translocation signal domain-containing protein [Candidatus Latescibacterota bacterium]